MNFVQLAIPFFILALLVEFCFGALIKRQTYRLSDTINSLQLGVLSRLVGLLRLSFAAVVISWFVGNLGVETWSPDHWIYWVLSFVAYDFCYYWKHRFGHEWRIMWASHVAHHQSQDYNLSTALRQTSTDYIGFVFYLPLYLLGMPVEVVITVGSLNLVYQFWVHTEHIKTLGLIDYILVTPANHRVHHAVNEGYLDKNYGGVFILWDRLFGTFVMEDPNKKCVYGIRHPLNSWNPLWANFHVWLDTFRMSLQAKVLRDKLLVWFRSPAWVPGGLATRPDQQMDSEKYQPDSSLFNKAYTFVQFWVVTGVALWLQASQVSLPRSLVLTIFVVLIASIVVQGCWLEARRYAYHLEWFRLVSLFLFSILFPLVWSGLVFELSGFKATLLLQGFCTICFIALLINHQMIREPKQPLSA